MMVNVFTTRSECSCLQQDAQKSVGLLAFSVPWTSWHRNFFCKLHSWWYQLEQVGWPPTCQQVLRATKQYADRLRYCSWIVGFRWFRAWFSCSCIPIQMMEDDDLQAAPCLGFSGALHKQLHALCFVRALQSICCAKFSQQNTPKCHYSFCINWMRIELHSFKRCGFPKGLAGVTLNCEVHLVRDHLLVGIYFSAPSPLFVSWLTWDHHPTQAF